jgi:hypothetical protein
MRRWAILLAAAIGLAVVGCGGAPAQPGAHAVPSVPVAVSPTGTPSPVAASPPPLTIFAIGEGGLPGGLQCPQWVVLTGSRAAFSTAELRQMADFLIKEYEPTSGRPLDPPPSFARTNVAIADPQAASTRYWNEPRCTMSLQVTNTGHETVQLPEIGVRLTAATRPNQTDYRLVEACSIESAPAYCGVKKGGGATPCGSYRVQLLLTAGNAGDSFMDRPVAGYPDGPTCPDITLGPNATVELAFTLRSAQAMAYPLEPVLKVRTSAGLQTVSTGNGAGTVEFASPSQFTCYQLSGQSLAVRWSGPDALDWPARSRDGAFCA